MAHIMTVMCVVMLIVLCFATYTSATLSVSNTLGSNMVLQREPLQAKLWGWAADGDTVTVNFNNQAINASAASDGTWSVVLPATTAGGPYVIEVSSSSGDTISLENILFGDVWVCGGQSNMQFTVNEAFNASYEIALADKYPNIRLFTVGQLTISPTPLSNLATTEQLWSVASAATVGGANWTYMSAVCWFFGRDLYNEYQVPIGLISSNWGGTYIQAWSSPEVLAQCNVPTPAFNASGGANQPSVLYNAMIVPFLPQSIRGATWYQGESNVGNAPLYACLEPAMIADWRAKFGSGYKFPFLFVMLGPWIAQEDMSIPVADLRVSQLAGLSLPSVGYASAFDLGDPTSPLSSIHPRDKQDVGARLVLAARNIACGETNVVWMGPTFASAVPSVLDREVNVDVTFTAYGEAGLEFRVVICPNGVETDICSGWEMQLEDGNWYDAYQVSGSPYSNVATISMDLPVFSQGLVKGIRYAYSIWPIATLYSLEGLPAVPFQYFFTSVTY